MFPVQNTTYVSQGLAKFTSRFTQEAAPNLRALAAVYLQGVQDLENAAFDVIQKKWLANAVGPDLDEIGDIVGQPRTGLDDNTYRAAIRLRIKANKSQGRSSDVVGLSLLIAKKFTADANGLVQYSEASDRSFLVTITNMLYVPIAQSLLTETRDVGARGGLVYSIWPAGDDFSFSSVYSSGAGEAGFSSVYSPSTGGLLLSELVT
jgi:hypothetical protein